MTSSAEPYTALAVSRRTWLLGWLALMAASLSFLVAIGATMALLVSTRTARSGAEDFSPLLAFLFSWGYSLPATGTGHVLYPPGLVTAGAVLSFVAMLGSFRIEPVSAARGARKRAGLTGRSGLAFRWSAEGRAQLAAAAELSRQLGERRRGGLVGSGRGWYVHVAIGLIGAGLILGSALLIGSTATTSTGRTIELDVGLPRIVCLVAGAIGVVSLFLTIPGRRAAQPVTIDAFGNVRGRGEPVPPSRGEIGAGSTAPAVTADPQVAATSDDPNGAPVTPAPRGSLSDRLTQLDEARASGLVTDEEYAGLREKVLAEV